MCQYFSFKGPWVYSALGSRDKDGHGAVQGGWREALRYQMDTHCQMLIQNGSCECQHLRAKKKGEGAVNFKLKT